MPCFSSKQKHVPFPLPECFPQKNDPPRAICFTRAYTLVGELGNAERRRKLRGREHRQTRPRLDKQVPPTGSVRVADKVESFEAALRLNQGASQASQPGAAAAAAGPPTTDGGGGTDAAGSPAADGGGGTASGGGGTDAQVIEFIRKISAMEALIEQLEQRNANLEESLQTPNSKFPSLLNYFKKCASSLLSV